MHHMFCILEKTSTVTLQILSCYPAAFKNFLHTYTIQNRKLHLTLWSDHYYIIPLKLRRKFSVCIKLNTVMLRVSLFYSWLTIALVVP